MCEKVGNYVIYASYEGHVEEVDKLLQHGTIVDLQDHVNTLMFKV